MFSKEEILQRLLSTIPDEFDKTEGSFFYDNLASVAEELEKGYTEQSKVLDNGFIDTATGNYLDRRCEEKDVIRKQATKATGTVTVVGSNGATINKGDKVASDTLTFTVLEDGVITTDEIDIAVECDEYGSSGNIPIGAIKYFPITIAGLNTVTNIQAFENGYDQENDEELKERYYVKVRTPATSGNKHHYYLWAKEVTGVGDAKVFSLWDGNGTVKVIIIDSNRRGANAQLISDVVEYIEGVRPIGATVTVESATELAINIKCLLTIDTDNYTIDNVLNSITLTVDKHLKDIAFKQDYISYAKIGSLVLDCDGVSDYANLLINDDIQNIILTENQVAVIGSVTNE